MVGLSMASYGPRPTTAPRTRVLVIDDEDLIGTVFARLLRDRHDVVAMTSARAALRRIEDGEHFDAVFCDILMPTMCAWEFYAQLEHIRPDLARRTVFLSGGAFTPKAAEFADRHRERVLDKPIEPGILRAVANRLTTV